MTRFKKLPRLLYVQSTQTNLEVVQEFAELDPFSLISQELLNNIPLLAILTLNDKGDIGYANRYACELFDLRFNEKTQQFGKLPVNLSNKVQAEINHKNYAFTMQFGTAENATTLNASVIYNTNPEQSKHCFAVYLSDQTLQLLNQTKLQNTENLLHTLMGASPDYICIKDGNNRWLKANPNYLNLLQLKSDDYELASNHEIANRLHPIFNSMLHYAEKSDEDAWRTNGVYHNEENIFLPDGSEKTLEVKKIALFDETNARDYLVMFAHDVTEKKFIEGRLQNRSAILDALISCDWLLHSADTWRSVAKTVLQQCCLSLRFTRAAILKINPDTYEDADYSEILYQWSAPGFMSPSKNLERINFTSKELARWGDILQKGNPVFTEVHELPEAERKLLKQHDTVCIAVVPLLLEGNWWGNIFIERCYDADKTSSQEIGALMAISRSLGVAIQREVNRKNLDLAKIAFDSATEGIMIIDTNGSIIGINKGYTNITGYTEEESLGKTPVVFQTGKHSLWESLSKDGKWCGELINHRKNGEKYHEWLTITVVENEAKQIMNYVGVFADITESKQSQEKLHKLVNHDPLTGLPNRRLINELFDHAIKRAERDKQQIAIFFIDLDRFKSINDSLGHQFGDKLLYEVSRRIKQSIRDTDVAGRLGGDEFIVMMDSVSSRLDVENKAKKILHALQTECSIDGKEIFITASIGISLFPNDGIDVDNIIKAADIAMYQVKNNGKNNFCFYEQEQSKEVIERFTLENQLRRALERNQFEIHYQPQVDLLTGDVIGAEALVRWRHPELGLISPDKFIPLAEETGIILHIGQWVLTQAAHLAKRWIHQHSTLKHISVNVSGVQIMQSNFADTVYGVLIETDCDASMLELEITESTVMQNTEFVINTFNNIKELGVGLSIDDFGTAYSSLSNLKRLPLDKLKIDRSFIQDLPGDADDAAITNAIYAMATSLGFNVIAEGVETKEQEAFLINMGCTMAQGFRYSKPINTDAFNELMLSKAQLNGEKHAK
jgi:diguanylate cyclase (GGDEF)-like protein/PAS domain S-box-containing protein